MRPSLPFADEAFVATWAGYTQEAAEGVPADLQLGEATWRTLSLTIRLEHECAHYVTLRVLGSMKIHCTTN